MFSKKKRVMSLLLAVMLLTVGLCACGSKGTNTGETAQPADTKTESASEEQKSHRHRKQKQPGRIFHRKLHWSCT